MRYDVPPRKLPFWSKREFRFLAGLGIILVGCIAVFVEITRIPAARKKDLDEIATQPGDIAFDVLSSVKDQTPLEEEDPYRDLLRHLSTVPVEALFQEARASHYDNLVAAPAKYRGRRIRVSGLAVKSMPIRLNKPIGGVEIVYRTYFVDHSSGEGYIGYVADLLKPPPALEYKKDSIVVDGIFYKVATYEGKDGMVKAPWLVAQESRRIKEQVASDVTKIDMILMVASVVGFVAVILIVWRANRRLIPRRVAGAGRMT